MIISFDKEIAALKPLFAEPETPERNLNIAFELTAGVFVCALDFAPPSLA